MIKKVAFIGHRVNDMERAKKFYGELLGWSWDLVDDDGLKALLSDF